MGEISIFQLEIDVLMKGLNLLHQQQHDLSDEEKDAIPVLAFKLGMASNEIVRGSAPAERT